MFTSLDSKVKVKAGLISFVSMTASQLLSIVDLLISVII